MEKSASFFSRILTFIVKRLGYQYVIIDKSYGVHTSKMPSCQGVYSIHNMGELYNPEYDRILKQAMECDPYNAEDKLRYRVYNILFFQKLTADVPGDIATCGVSFGVVPRAIYYSMNKDLKGKKYYLIDPLSGQLTKEDTKKDLKYCYDRDTVINSFSKDFVFIEKFIPDAISDINSKLSFLHVNTGDIQAEAKFLSQIDSFISPGGVIMIDNYGIDQDGFKAYAGFVNSSGYAKLQLPSGQLVLIKNRITSR